MSASAAEEAPLPPPPRPTPIRPSKSSQSHTFAQMHTPAHTSQCWSRQTQHGFGVCTWMHLVNGTGQQPISGTADPGVVKQDRSSRGSVDTTKTRSDPQRVRMSSGERNRRRQRQRTNTMASCQPPPPPPHACTQPSIRWPQSGGTPRKQFLGHLRVLSGGSM